TGSVGNGRKVIEASAEHITPVILELGSNDAMIVCDDANLEQAVQLGLAGVFIAAGQNCIATERVLVHEKIYERFVARVVEVVGQMRQGPPLESTVDIGAIVSPAQLDRIEHLVQDAIAKGASCLAGGKRVLSERGQFFAPTVL